jgi:hypothetical protein
MQSSQKLRRPLPHQFKRAEHALDQLSFLSSLMSGWQPSQIIHLFGTGMAS